MNRSNLIFTILFLSIFSCSTNDNISFNDRSLVGTWKTVKYADVCSTGSEETIEMDNCEQETRYIFLENGNLSISEFDIDLENGNCVETYSTNGTYLLFAQDDLIYKIDGKELVQTVFKLTDNILQIGVNFYSNPDFTCDENGLLSYSYTEFERVE